MSTEVPLQNVSPPALPASWRFDVPATIVHGGGARRRVPEIARELGATRVLLVTDAGVVRLGAAEELRGLLVAAGLEVAVFDQVQPDPTDTNVEAGTAILESHRADLIVALGGGSPIDAAKVIAVRHANPGPLSNYMGRHKIPRRGVPLIAVPTTAGTGSEATKVAVITDTERCVKMMMLSASLTPTAAVVDYELSLSMPPALTAAVGVDTLTHGIEAFVSRQANPLTDPLALQCVELTAKHLRTAWAEPTHRVAREAMMQAATLGGMAFANSSVCLVHGMSRPLGIVFHLPHGLSNAVLLPTVTRFSVSSAPDRYAEVARRIGCARIEETATAACEALVDWLAQLNHDLRIPSLVNCPGVTRELLATHAEKMASDALASGSPANNPRVPTAAEIITLYHAAAGSA